MNLSFLKPALFPLFYLFQIVNPAATQTSSPSSHFQYQRTLTLDTALSSGQTCAVLDADVFAHAAPTLKDLRLYSDQTEIPYAITVSEPLQQENEEARILNLTARVGRLTFDLEMPHRPYTTVVLDLAPKDFVARVTVSGIDAPGDKKASFLGTFALFDLTSQHLSRNTAIPLSESTFPYLHIDLALKPVRGGSSSAATLNLPATVRSATVPPSREAQSLYTTTQQTEAMTQTGRESTDTFRVPIRVPIERVAFALPFYYKGSFSRTVKIEAQGTTNESSSAGDNPDAIASQASFEVESIVGTIFRVYKSEAGQDLSAESLAIPVSIGSNMQQPAVIAVTIDNGAGRPLPLTVKLQMRQRRICFDSAAASSQLSLVYGDLSLDAPIYNDARLSQAAANPLIAQLGPERSNPNFKAAPVIHKAGRHPPVLRWIALLGCVCIFALLVIRRTQRKPQ